MILYAFTCVPSDKAVFKTFALPAAIVAVTVPDVLSAIASASLAFTVPEIVTSSAPILAINLPPVTNTSVISVIFPVIALTFITPPIN